jgi:hypothetical protein
MGSEWIPSNLPYGDGMRKETATMAERPQDTTDGKIASLLGEF